MDSESHSSIDESSSSFSQYEGISSESQDPYSNCLDVLAGAATGNISHNVIWISVMNGATLNIVLW